MGAAPAFLYNYPERAFERSRRPSVRVVPGQGTRTNNQTIPSTVIFMAKTLAVVFVVAALLCFARIALGSATVATSMQTQQLENQITNARTSGSNLEVQQSSLANPTRVKIEASRLNMAAPASVGVLDLGADVVATDETGNLSLSKSVQIAAAAAE